MDLLKYILICVFATGAVYAFSVEARGILMPVNDIMILSQGEGIVSEIVTAEGSQVKTGQAIVKLDNQDAFFQLKLAETRLEKLTAAYNKMKSGALSEEIRKAEASVEVSKIKMTEKKKEYETNKSLFETSFLAEKALESSRQEYMMAQAEYEKALIDLDLMKKGSRPEDLTGARADMEGQRYSLEQERLKYERQTMSSPINGICAEIKFEPGEMVKKNDEVARVIADDYLIIELDIPVENVTLIQKNQKVQVITELNDLSYEGHVIFVSPVVDPGSKTFRVKVSLNNENRSIKPGIFARVIF